MQNSALEGGFADQSIDAARAFRAVLDAMARPGRIYQLTGARPPAPLSTAAGCVALTLCDPNTPVHLSGDLDTPEIREWIGFHTGAPVVGASEAMFAFGSWQALTPLDRLPDRHA